MAFNLKGNVLMITMQITGAAMQAMTEAETDLSANSTGEQKKAFVMRRGQDIMKIQDMVDADLMTPEQEAAILKSFDLGVEFAFSSYETAKLFKTPAPPTV